MPTLGELATYLELELHGDPDTSIEGLAAIDVAEPQQLSFISEKKAPSSISTYAGRSGDSSSGVDEAWSGPALLSPTPYVSYAHARVFDNHPASSGDIHTAAIVAECATG